MPGPIYGRAVQELGADPTTRNGRSPRALAVLLLSVVVLFTAAIPAVAYLGSAYYSYDGPICDWDGAHEHWDYNSPINDHAGGATGLQDGYDYGCDETRLKIYWEPWYANPRLTSYKGARGVNTTVWNVEFLYYTDHDVFYHDAEEWHGWRMTH